MDCFRDNEYPDVSIIMSVYNGRKYLKECIDSIINQTFVNWELLIIDDCSTDDSGKILYDYSLRDNRIIINTNSENKGLTVNLNRLIELAKGKYIARMDSDDVCELTRLEKQFNYLEQNQTVDILGTNCIEIDEYGNEKGIRKSPESSNSIRKTIKIVNPISHPTVMMRKDSLVCIGYYDTRYRTSQDYALWLKALGNGLIMYNLQENLLYYRINDDYYNRKSFSYRKNEMKIRFNGYRLNKFSIFTYIYCLIPLIQGVVPKKMYILLKKIDPRK